MVDESRYKEYLKSPKWKAIAEKRLMIDGHTCQGCGSRGTARNPLEVHHLSYKYIYHEEERIFEDLVTLCHECHKNIHAIMNRVTNADGRRGWKDNANIPKISVWTINGTDKQSKEV